MRWQYHLPALVAGLLFTGCAGKGGSSAETGENPYNIPTGALAANAAEFGTPIKRGENQAAAAEAAAKALGYNPETDLAHTDPDNPDAELPELQELMAQGPKQDSWRRSESESLRESRRTGKPMLIWFTDSLNSSASKTLSDQLLTTSEFQDWAEENTVRLVVDQNQGSNIDDAVRKKIHSRELKKKYNARGYPTLMVVAPSGEVIGRYTGYRRGKEDFIFGQVKQGVHVAAENQKVWRSSLEKKGYREWSDVKGRKIFAKLGAYKDGELILVEPDGTRARTQEKRLSAEDRVWIQQQKEARGIH
ncbi:thioredoxin fold domain-containing protein [Luteolibacter luteus]|uniref:Thioredoxin family protein n=1 Tax=Luteolibacter luteus TaxID=2728835 RepID=A0A858RM38_9BACT|nr:thioredoxin fold domain-containing protein [Luteolibacter luteus]QJE98446.1 thioredoxin family protein [Luteolibacter luteus]